MFLYIRFHGQRFIEQNPAAAENSAFTRKMRPMKVRLIPSFMTTKILFPVPNSTICTNKHLFIQHPAFSHSEGTTSCVFGVYFQNQHYIFTSSALYICRKSTSAKPFRRCIMCSFPAAVPRAMPCSASVLCQQADPADFPPDSVIFRMWAWIGSQWVPFQPIPCNPPSDMPVSRKWA